MTAIDKMLAELQSRDWPSDGRCKVARANNGVAFLQGGMQAFARDAEGILVEVMYEYAPHELAKQRCSPGDAARLIEAIFRRASLHRVELRDASQGAISGESP